jgi:PhoD-like phosphatase
MAFICGPILGFRGQIDGHWHLTVALAQDDATSPGGLFFAQQGGAPGPEVAPTLLGEAGGARFFGYAFAVPMNPEASAVEYGLGGDGRRWSFVVPAIGQLPRIAYASCNGFSLPGDMKKIADKNALWRDVMAEHGREPFHLLLMGGDQIYADQLWDIIPEMRRFNELPRDQRMVAVPGPTLRQELEKFYVDTYRDRFSQTPIADALATIPSLMMWDDHDIFDGWGSYSPEEQSSPVFQTIYDVARTCFSLFQLQSDPHAPSWPALPGQPSFNALLRLGTLGLLVLDLRSERSQREILSLDTWNVVFDALDRAIDLGHLLVMSSIPVVHPDLSLLERAFVILPGAQDLEDDLHDQWVSYTHQTERLRLIHRLLDYAEATGTRVTILSGDVHVAALGVIESTRRPVRWLNSNVINQLTSSAIVHPSPPRVVRFFLEQIGVEVKEIDQKRHRQDAAIPRDQLPVHLRPELAHPRLRQPRPDLGELAGRRHARAADQGHPPRRALNGPGCTGFPPRQLAPQGAALIRTLARTSAATVLPTGR